MRPTPYNLAVATTLSDPLTGRLLDGRYDVGRLVARGGMATVYEAMDTRLERIVAIKVMHPALAADAEFVARFIREARSAARLSHPNVVAVYDQGSDGDVVYLAMEYVDGATLRDLLRMRGRLAPADALAIFEQVLGALGAAHKAGLVHRDVKPENVLLTEDGRVKVADFGLARAISSSVSSNTMTTGMIIGTVSYLSPEQVERSIADARSDVYAAGIMLFEMLTGEKPYTGGTPMEVAFRHVHERVPAPSTIAPGISHDVDTLVLRATARNPDDRPRDATELLIDVTRARDGRPIFLQQLEADVEPTVRHHDLEALRPGPGDTLVAPRPVLGGRQDPSLPPLPDANMPLVVRRRRRRGWILFLVVLLLGAAAATGAWWYADGRFTTTPVIQTGAAQATALAALERVGLEADITPIYSESVAVGAVVKTDPGPGERVLSGGTVRVDVSKGPERYEVPDVATLTPVQAAALLDDQPLVLAGQRLAYSETIPSGQVIGTEPAAHVSVKRDTEIMLVISRGRESFPIPTVEGETADEAKQILSDAGFVPIEDPQVFHDTVPAGVVVSQSPKDASGVRESGVHIVVSKGPELFEVPGVVGKQKADAQEILEAAGFVVVIDYPLGTAVFSTVYSQSEPAGTMLPRGASITLQIV
jgi:beta-lactam-binding protein with PASTA domain/tRNA A-37 threonylcarbamoyl transferase component Bud32